MLQNKLLLLLFLFVITACSKNLYRLKNMKFHPNIIVAHRGAWKKQNHPENSIAALRHAIDLQYTGSEFDVRMTKDEVLVINHDPAFHDLDIEAHTYAELIPFKLSNQEILPTLKMYLDKGIHKNDGTQLVLEIKPSAQGPEHGKYIAKKVFELVRIMKAESWIGYISFDLGILETLESLDPKVSTQYLNGELSPGQLKALGINGLDYHYAVFKEHPDWIQEAKTNHLILNTWTVNDASDMDFFIQAGFDYITTNEPALLQERIRMSKTK